MPLLVGGTFAVGRLVSADIAIANTETVVCSYTCAANDLRAGTMFHILAYATRAGTQSASAIARIRIGTTTLIGNIAASVTQPASNLAVPIRIEGIVEIRTDGSGGTALGSIEMSQHLAAVTITDAISPTTATVGVDTTAANQKVELTFISAHANNTFTFRNAFIRVVA